MKDATVNVNGKILQPPESYSAQIPVFDRGFLYGDSIYEVARTYGGKFFLLDEHMKRLTESARLCRMLLGQPAEFYAQEMRRTFEAFRSSNKAEAYGRLIVTRGVGRIGFGLNCVESPPQFVVIVQPVDAPTDEQVQRGMSVRVAERLRNSARALDPAMKSGNYLNSLLAYLEAKAEHPKAGVERAEYDDAVLCDADGHLTEGTTFNIFYVKRGIVATPPLDVGVLEGITRRHVIELARGAGLEVREVRFPRERFFGADEAFLTSSIREVFPITKVDGSAVGSGRPGPVTLKLRGLMQRLIAETSRGAA